MSPFALDGPADPAVPLFLDSPHSGSDYPADFTPRVPLSACRSAEDFAVDALFGAAPQLGLPLLKALFPRIYVDVNRAAADIEPEAIAGTLPFAADPSVKAELGKGVIWTKAPPPLHEPLYEGPLPVADIMGRLTRCWRPYRDRLDALAKSIHQSHGRVFYLNCHSMQSISTAMHEEGAGITRPEIVLGDRDGTTCSPAFTSRVGECLAQEGFTVAINIPYKGADLVRALGRPAQNVHALQVEIRRDLYMDERTLTRGPGFDDVRDRLGRALQALRGGPL